MSAGGGHSCWLSFIFEDVGEKKIKCGGLDSNGQVTVPKDVT